MIYKRAKVDDVKGDEQCMMSQDDKRFVLKLVNYWSFKCRIVDMFVAWAGVKIIMRKVFDAWGMFDAWEKLKRTMLNAMNNV